MDALKKQFPASESVADIALLLAIKDQSPAAAIEQLQVDTAHLCNGVSTYGTDFRLRLSRGRIRIG